MGQALPLEVLWALLSLICYKVADALDMRLVIKQENKKVKDETIKKYSFFLLSI